jgi:hypothetical protein
LPSGHIDRAKNIFQSGPLGIKPDRKQVLLGVVVHLDNTREGSDGGAHGVGAAASHEAAALYHARHPEFDLVVIHAKSSGEPVHPDQLFLILALY